MLVEFSLYISSRMGKFFQFMVFIFLENGLNLRIFTYAPVPHSKFQVEFFENLSFALSKFDQKIWRWPGTLVIYILYDIWFSKCDGFTVLEIISVKECGIKFIDSPLQPW